jgi:predicted nucleic acid-binding protein
MSVLVDSSLWVDYLKLGERGPGAALGALLASGEVVMCGLVAAELIAGTPPKDRSERWRQLAGLRWAPELQRDDWYQVGRLAGDLAAAGHHPPLADLQIAVAAAREQAPLWTRDKHFTTIRQAVPGLTLYRP